MEIKYKKKLNHQLPSFLHSPSLFPPSNNVSPTKVDYTKYILLLLLSLLFVINIKIERKEPKSVQQKQQQQQQKMNKQC